VGVRGYDNNYRAADCLPAKLQVGSVAVHRSINEPGDACPDNRDYADLPL